LIETVGLRIVNKIKKELKNIEKVTVKVTKINPPINGDVENVAIIIEE
jgi:dihydroneopterin aldolase